MLMHRLRRRPRRFVVHALALIYLPVRCETSINSLEEPLNITLATIFGQGVDGRRDGAVADAVFSVPPGEDIDIAAWEWCRQSPHMLDHEVEDQQACTRELTIKTKAVLEHATLRRCPHTHFHVGDGMREGLPPLGLRTKFENGRCTCIDPFADLRARCKLLNLSASACGEHWQQLFRVISQQKISGGPGVSFFPSRGGINSFLMGLDVLPWDCPWAVRHVGVHATTCGAEDALQLSRYYRKALMEDGK